MPILISEVRCFEAGVTGALAKLFTSKGTVRLTKDGEVRWTTWSIFHGDERWRSEGIQIGGPRSARGVFGTWFDRYFYTLYMTKNRWLTLMQRLRPARPSRPDGVLEGERLRDVAGREP